MLLHQSYLLILVLKFRDKNIAISSINAHDTKFCMKSFAVNVFVFLFDARSPGQDIHGNDCFRLRVCSVLAK